MTCSKVKEVLDINGHHNTLCQIRLGWHKDDKGFDLRDMQFIIGSRLRDAEDVIGSRLGDTEDTIGSTECYNDLSGGWLLIEQGLNYL